MRSRYSFFAVALALALLGGGLAGCAATGDPDVASAQQSLQNEDYDAAIASLDAALETDPANLNALTLRAEVLRLQAEQAQGAERVEYLEDLVATIERARAVEPGNPAVDLAVLNAWAFTVNSGNEALRADEPDFDAPEAIALFDASTELQPDSVQGYFGLGLAQLRAGNTSEAVVPLRRAVEMDPDDVTSAYYLGRALLYSDQASEAVTVLEDASTRFPDDADIRTALLNAYARSGDTDRAIEQYELAVQGTGAEDPVVRYNYGALLLNAGRFDEAIEQLNEAVRLNPENADAYYNLGATYQNKAAAINDEANQAEDNTEVARLNAERDENLEASLPYLQRARELAAAAGDDEGSVCLALFRVYTQLGRVDDAEGVAECAGVSMN